MKVELLILISGDDTFCNSARSFIDFLKIDSQISITQQNITFKKTNEQAKAITAKFHVDTSKVKSNDERYFSLTLTCDSHDRIDDFSELVERLKVIAERISPETCTINTLWDDIGRTYAERSYPIINETENLMRKLIAKFMLITVGMKWTKDAIQPELFSKIENFEEEAPYINDLHKLDFIHLSQVLFSKKRDISQDELDRLLIKTKFEKEDTDKILKFIPRSNWDKYFSEIVEGKDTNLEQKWALLYKLRNKVAHNRNVKKSEHDQIIGLAKAIQEIISKAIEKLGEIKINQEDRESIIYSYQPNSSNALAYQAERSVGEFYAQQGYTFNDGTVGPFQFIAVKDDELTGVDILMSRNRTFHLVYQNIIKHFPVWTRSAKRLDLKRVHAVCVMTDYSSDLPLESIIARIEQTPPRFQFPFELTLGFIDENNNFIPIYQIKMKPLPAPSNIPPLKNDDIQESEK